MRRIRRACAVWELNLRWLGFPVRSTMMVSFTTASPDPGAAYGAMTHWMNAYSQRWGQRDVIWVGETQGRGAAHFHAILVNPPTLAEGFSHVWMTETWGLGHVHFRRLTREQFRRCGVRYLTNYFKDKGSKAYQHDYEHWPRGVRSVGMRRPGWPRPVLEAHLTRYVGVLLPALGDRHTRGLDCIGVYERLEHVDNDYCPPGRSPPSLRPAPPPLRERSAVPPRPSSSAVSPPWDDERWNPGAGSPCS